MATYIPKKRTETGTEDLKFPISSIDGLQEEINEIKGNLSSYQPKTDESLATTDKIVVGAINEVNDKTYSYSIGLAYTLSDDETYYIVSGIGTCTDTDIKIPPKYKGLPVREVGESAFAGTFFVPNSSITSVVFPNTIIKIDANAFSYCNAIKSINLPEGLLEIGDTAFNFNTSLIRVTLPSTVVTIGSSAFFGAGFDSIIIPKSVTTLGHTFAPDSADIYCEIAEKPEGWDDNFAGAGKVIWNASNDFISVNEKLENLPAGIENAVLIFNVSTYPYMSMSAIVNAIENAGGDISKSNYVQFNGWLTNLLLMQFRSYGGNTYKVICNDVTNGYKIYNGTTDNVIDISTKTLDEFIAEGTPVTMPQIRFANFQDTNGTLRLTEDNPFTFTIELVGGGALQQDDLLQICVRRKYNYDQGTKSKWKLRCVVSRPITYEDIGKRFLSMDVSLSDVEPRGNWLFRNDRRPQKIKPAELLSGVEIVDSHSYIYFRIKRVNKYNSDGDECGAIFSNVERVAKTYRADIKRLTIK